MFCDNQVLVFHHIELPSKAPLLFFHKFQLEYILDINIKVK